MMQYGNVDVFVMTENQYTTLKQSRQDSAQGIDIEGPLGIARTLGGIPIETYPTHGQCVARAMELMQQKVSVGLVAED